MTYPIPDATLRGGYTGGYDMGWNVYPGFGGCSDFDFSAWMPAPELPSLATLEQGVMGRQDEGASAAADPALVNHAPAGHGPSGFDPAREEFVRRFKAHMLKRAGRATFDDGDSIAEYADMTAPSYYDEPRQRAEGPEACADADMSYWGE